MSYRLECAHGNSDQPVPTWKGLLILVAAFLFGVLVAFTISKVGAIQSARSARRTSRRTVRYPSLRSRRPHCQLARFSPEMARGACVGWIKVTNTGGGFNRSAQRHLRNSV